ncbi:hypothetical protein, partial [Methylobacterium fujisawaense]
ANQNVIVGALKVEKIGKKYRLEVGEELEIVVGKSRFVMDKEGNITLQGETHTHSASGPIQMNGKTIDLN